MPVSQRQLAAHWGISQPSVNAHVKKGCPLHSLKAADLWRQARIAARSATTGKAAQITSKPGRPRNAAKVQPTGDTLLDILNATNLTHREAHRVLMEAIAAKDVANLPPLLSVSTKAAEAAMAAETAYRQEQERRGILVNKSEIIDTCRRAMDAILRRLKRLPTESGPQCNETDPLKATQILERAVKDIMATGAKALSDLK